jgi:DNA replication protein DnaC
MVPNPKASMPTSTGRWLTLAGLSGTGKTHLAKELMRFAEINCKWWKCSHLGTNRYRDFFSISGARLASELRSPGGFSFIWELTKTDLLFIDDFGAARDPSGYLTDSLFALLDNRLGKWTILTTNLTGEGLHAMDPRISSRLIRGANILHEVNAPDFATRHLFSNK